MKKRPLLSIEFCKFHDFISKQVIKKLVCDAQEHYSTIHMQFKSIEYLNSVMSYRRSKIWHFYPRWPPLPVATNQIFQNFALNPPFSSISFRKST